MKLDDITPYGTGRGDKPRQVREMFDRIAPSYDLLNRAMTLGIDRRWRARAVERLRSIVSPRVLDLATGTGDFAIKLARSLAGSRVTGLDLSPGMIEVGRAKVARASLERRVELLLGDALELPFGPEEFDAVTCAFGVRNYADLHRGYSEMLRVLRPGGTAVILELSTPTSLWAAPLYRLYAGRIIPALGRLVSRDGRAYSYLPESIAAVPQGGAMTEIMLGAGFATATATPLTFGAATIYEGLKAL